MRRELFSSDLIIKTANRILFLSVFMLVCPVFSQETSDISSAEITEQYNKNKELAQKLGIITGTAINPLLVSGIMGGIEYYKTPDVAKNTLPWHQQPWFIILCFVMIGAAFLPSILSIFGFPPFFASISEQCNKIVGFIFSTPIILNIISDIATNTLQATFAGERAYIAASIIPFEFSTINVAITTILLFLSFFVIWATNYLFDVLIMISPFGWLDIGLKCLRGLFFILLAVLVIFAPKLMLVMYIALTIIAFFMLRILIRKSKDAFYMIKSKILNWYARKAIA